jgi:hypothetical protein
MGSVLKSLALLLLFAYVANAERPLFSRDLHIRFMDVDKVSSPIAVIEPRDGTFRDGTPRFELALRLCICSEGRLLAFAEVPVEG